ncbi:DNA-3-methyladenine glycosylase I [Candidatus Woesearchaeota archaeon]|nr:DNA-3-methyladenine glycosylase I [Candidatus Woesearchaeota archaeon]
MASYCSFARKSNGVHREHHDTEHGFEPKDDNDLFRRLILEISQAGLSFETILKKKKTIYKAFSTVDIVSSFDDKDIKKLMQNPGIIRNKLKILSAIHNAKKIKEIQKEHGSFGKWLDKHHPLKKDEWVKLFKNTFKFTGGEIVNEFMMSIGYLAGAHDEDCPVGKKLNPKYEKKNI